MRLSSLLVMSAILHAMPFPCQAQGISTANVHFSGFGAVTLGQIVKGTLKGEEIENVWQERLFVQLNTHAKLRERMEIVLGLEGMLSFSYPEQKLFFDTQLPRFIIYPHHVAWSYSFGSSENPWLGIKLGYFPYKYNPEATNLGEYLLRSGVYPNYIVNDFDFALTRVLGIHLFNVFLNLLRQDLLLTSETEAYPTQDWSLSYLASVRVFNMLTIGAGVCFSRLIPVDPKRTTPKDPANAYAIKAIDTLPDGMTVRYDSSFYTFKGTKLMGRLAIDPKRFISVDIFGPEDLKLYAEIAVLGVKNYPAKLNDSLVAYDEISERIPIMFGFHFPAFKLLDVLAIEAEWYRSPYTNNRFNQLTENIPQPYAADIDTSVTGDWKWSVYARRTIFRHLAIKAQIARDHTHVLDHRTDLRKSVVGDALRDWDHWMWLLKLEYAF